MHFNANYGSIKQYWQMFLGIICKTYGILSLWEFPLLPTVVKFWLSSKDKKANFCVDQSEIVFLGFMVWDLLQRSLNWGMATGATAKGCHSLGLSVFLTQGMSLLSSGTTFVTTIATKINCILPWPSLIILQGVFFDVRSLIQGDPGCSVKKRLLLLTVMVFKFIQGQHIKQNWRVATPSKRNCWIWARASANC